MLDVCQISVCFYECRLKLRFAVKLLNINLLRSKVVVQSNSKNFLQIFQNPDVSAAKIVCVVFVFYDSKVKVGIQLSSSGLHRL